MSKRNPFAPFHGTFVGSWPGLKKVKLELSSKLTSNTGTQSN